MTEIGGTIPSVNQKKFLGKMDPLSEIISIFVKKIFGKIMKNCKTCNVTKELTEFRTGRGECKACENRKRVERKNKQKVEDPTYYEKQRGYDNKRKKIMRENFTDEEKFVENLRNLVRKSFSDKNYTKDSRTFEILGIDNEGLYEHIESQFREGMDWGNHGHKGWHIDHIIPLASAKTVEEIIKLNHYTNLQPLWWNENLSKGSKIL
jgi:hypothetical protein